MSSSEQAIQVKQIDSSDGTRDSDDEQEEIFRDFYRRILARLPIQYSEISSTGRNLDQ